MKKILSLAVMLLSTIGVFTACEDDNDSNPTLIQPTEFTLNTPVFSGSEVDLAHSSGVALEWSQPVYTTDNAPVVATYEVQVSNTGEFAHSLAEANADATGATVGDYTAISTTFTKCSVSVPAEEIALALTKVCGWKANNVPDTQTAYIRIRAYVKSADGVEHNSITSNVVSLTTVPYFVDDQVEIWYLVGQNIGDGSWGNSGKDNIGVSLIPMYQLDDNVGKPIITFTGYFTNADGFKLIKTPGSWDDQWGATTNGTLVKNDDGSGNIYVPADGYYTITLDTRNDNLKIEKAEVTPTVNAQMLITGDFDNWAAKEQMSPVNTNSAVSAHNHVWTYTLDATGGATTAKFLTDSSWATNWGSNKFPIGIGTQGGDNIPISQGKWIITFNDIDGAYVFTSLSEE